MEKARIEVFTIPPQNDKIHKISGFCAGFLLTKPFDNFTQIYCYSQAKWGNFDFFVSFS